MSGLAKIVLIGNLGRDPESKTNQSGNEFCRFSVAVNSKEQGNDVTQWFAVNVYGKTGEACAKYLHKGSQVYVEGNLKASTYKDKKSGETKMSLDVFANNVVFIGSRDNKERPSNSATREAPKADDGFIDDDLPF